MVSITLARDEQDIIEPFVRHTLMFIDVMFVADHESTDATAEILARLAAEDARLVVGQARGLAYAQSERMTGLLRLALASVRADFLLPLDADEFLRADSREAFLQALRSIPAGAAGLLPWQTYVLPADVQRAARDPPRSLRLRRAREHPCYRKVAIRVDTADAADLVIEMGSHAVIRRNGERVAMPDLAGVHLVHVPVRSHDQIAGKIVTGWLATLAHDREAQSGDMARHWRALFDRLLAAGALTAQELRDLSLTYAQDATVTAAATRLVRDPVAWRYERRYSTGAAAPALARVARAWRASLLAARSPAAGAADLEFPDALGRVRALIEAGRLSA